MYRLLYLFILTFSSIEAHPFPEHLTDVTLISDDIGGSTGASLVAWQGAYYIQKGPSPIGGKGHLLAEYYANKLYKEMGVPVPEVQLYESTMLAQFIEGVPLSSAIGDASELQKHFVLDCLLANWDVLGLEYDNIIVDSHGKPWRVDNGSSFNYRAQGALKGELWGEKVLEIESMRSYNPVIFGSIPEEEIQKQITEIVKNQEKIISLVPDIYKPVIKKRIKYLNNR